MFYYLIIGLQIFCFYHAYKNKKNIYWYFILFFVPLLGCIIYLLTQVINKKDVTNISQEITTIINPTKKINDLEKVLQFSKTFQNRINLADAYSNNKDYNNAIINYEKALESNFKNDPFTLNKLIFCYYKTENFDKVIAYCNKINLDKDFKNTYYFYALALEQKGKFNEAALAFKKIDIRYSNYTERVAYAKFLIRRNKENEAKEILEEITTEINTMTKVNAKKYKTILLQANKLLLNND